MTAAEHIAQARVLAAGPYLDSTTLDIDPSPVILLVQGGVWVQAWIWVDDPDITGPEVA